MASARPAQAAPPLRPLSKQQIDRRIERLMSEIAAAGLDAPEEGATSTETLRPRPIRPAELIRRLRPFVSLN